MRYAGNARRGAYTLVELVVSMSVATILMGGLASTIVLASRAMPGEQTTSRSTIDGYYAAEQIAGELLCAKSFTVRSATAVEFTVADRSDDVGEEDETIRYEWSGTPGDALMRNYNGTGLVDVLTDVHELNLTYGIRTKSETTIQDGTAWTADDELASFDGWAGVTATLSSHVLGPGYMDSESFVVTPPEGATELKFTSASVMLSHSGAPPPAVEVAIHRVKDDGSFAPEPSPIGTPASIPGTELTNSPLWVDATFSDVGVTDLTGTGFCLVVTVPVTPPANVYFYYAKSAPANGMVHRWTEDGGASWDPRASQINQYDMRFQVYGSFATGGQQEITVDRYFVTSAGITLQAGSDSSARVDTAVQVLNAPEVDSP
jgi:hypothetical protein